MDPVRIRLADPGHGPRSIPEELRRRFPERRAELDAALACGEVVTELGTPVTERTPRTRNMDVWTYRTPEPEFLVPFEITVVHRDGRLLVADKPHFLTTAPRAGHVTETALVRLRRQTGIDTLAPAHRLDRLTAGVLVFTVDPVVRGRYQDLFASRRVDKSYLAVAPAGPDTPTRRSRSSRIVKSRGVLQAAEVEGEPDSHTEIELLERRGELGLYRLRPTTGRTHQLRVHMAALGTPIVGDDLYPTVRDVAEGDFSAPLQLLSESIGFRDPVDGTPREFRSSRSLRRWDDARGHADGRESEADRGFRGSEPG